MTAIPETEAIHATALALGEYGMVIRGPSGAGKSALARALLRLADIRGVFARLVADDRVLISNRNGRLIARPHPRIRGLVEVRGRGILPIVHEPGVVLHCIVDLAPGLANCGDLPRLPADTQMKDLIGGVELPRLTLPVATTAGDLVAGAYEFCLEHGR